MTNITTAIILLDPPPAGYKLLLDRKIATVPLFKRLALTLDRAGMENIFIVSRKLAPEDRKRIEEDIKGDSRFRRNLYWYDEDSFVRENAMEEIRKVSGGAPCLVLSGNIVTSFRLIRSFVREAANALGEDRAVALGPAQPAPGGVYLAAPEALDLAERFAGSQSVEEPAKTIEIHEKTGFWAAVGDHLSANRAEKRLIQNQKYHHSQVMDQRVNTIFSIPITRGLLRTSVTPNQVTLSGVFIGFISFCLLATGNYLGGLLGGLAAAADCCDGEIARLKFLDSDAGEYLDRVCDNIINVLVFAGIAIGMARQFGTLAAVTPAFLMAVGGGAIFSLIYFKKDQGKGEAFQGTNMFDLIELLATRDFLYMILAFGVIGKTHWFLWIAALGSIVFAGVLYNAKRKLNMEQQAQVAG